MNIATLRHRNFLEEIAPYFGIDNIQTGYVYYNDGVSTGSGEDTNYYSITISSVDTSKAIAFFDGYWTTISAGYFRWAFVGNDEWRNATIRIYDSTHIRISSTYDDTTGWYLNGRWTVVEFL